MDKLIKKPSHLGYHMQETGKTCVAIAWPHDDGQGGFTVDFIAPLSSDTLVFLPLRKKEESPPQ